MTTWKDIENQESLNDDSFTCEDCGKKTSKRDEDGNEKCCLRCEAVFMAQINYED